MVKPNVLIVEDEPAVGALLAETIASAGCAAVVVSDGATALDRVRSGDFALVVSDIRMPGLDGLELLRRIKAFAPEIEVIIVTALSDVERAREMIRLGASDYLTKPFDLDEVVSSVKRAIDKYQAWKSRCAHQRDLQVQIERQTRQIKEHLLSSQEQCARLRETVDVLQTTYDATLEALILALDYRDHEPKGEFLD